MKIRKKVVFSHLFFLRKHGLTSKRKRKLSQQRTKKTYFSFLQIKKEKQKQMFLGERNFLHAYDDGTCGDCRLDCIRAGFANHCDDRTSGYEDCIYQARAREYNCTVNCLRAGFCDSQLDMIPPPPTTCVECTDRVDNQARVCESECNQVFEPIDVMNQQCRSLCDEQQAFNQLRCYEYGMCRR